MALTAASSLLQSMAGPKQAVLAAALRLCVLLLSLSPCVVGGVLCAGTACLRLPKCPHTPDNSTLWQLVSAYAPGLLDTVSLPVVCYTDSAWCAQAHQTIDGKQATNLLLMHPGLSRAR